MANQDNTSSDQNSGQSKVGAETETASRSHETAEQLKSAALEQAEEIREKADSMRSQALERVRRVGSVLKSAGAGIRSEDSFVAGYADRAAQKIEDMAEYLGSTEPRVLARDAERIARDNPAWFFGGAFVLGLAGARFLKSTSERHSESSSPPTSAFGGNTRGGGPERAVVRFTPQATRAAGKGAPGRDGQPHGSVDSDRSMDWEPGALNGGVGR